MILRYEEMTRWPLCAFFFAELGSVHDHGTRIQLSTNFTFGQNLSPLLSFDVKPGSSRSSTAPRVSLLQQMSHRRRGLNIREPLKESGDYSTL